MLQYLKVPGYLQFVRETQLDPGEGKCSSFAVPSNVLSRHLLDSVLPLLVTLCLLHNNNNNNNANSTKCTELGWTCIPMAVETFGHWGRKAQGVLSRLASHLSISLSQPRAAMVADIYGRLNIILVRSVSRAILSRLPQSG